MEVSVHKYRDKSAMVVALDEEGYPLPENSTLYISKIKGSDMWRVETAEGVQMGSYASKSKAIDAAKRVLHNIKRSNPGIGKWIKSKATRVLPGGIIQILR